MRRRRCGRRSTGRHNGGMPNRRSAIAMTQAETREFLNGVMTADLTTLGADGWPHSVAMWFAPDDEVLRMWTYRKSQKVLNLKRDPRFAVLIESGQSYNELKGILVRGRARILEDFDEVKEIGKTLHGRYVLGEADYTIDPHSMSEIERQAHKRVGLELPLERLATWDHSKLG